MSPATESEQNDLERGAHQSFDAQPGCEICGKILTYASQVNKPLKGPTLGIAEDVLRSQCSHMALFQDWLYQLTQEHPHRSKSLLTVVHGYHSVKLEVICFALEATPGDNRSHSLSNDVGLLRKLTVPNHPGVLRAVDPQWIDMGLSKQWIVTCDRTHRNQCRKSSWLRHHKAARPKYLIDTLEMCVVEGEHIKTEYIALSYQWGQTKTLRNTTEIREKLLKPSSLSDWGFARYIPQTISDAFVVVKLLGYRYLWVDALCVIQDDHAAFATELRRMHLIYNSASFTIVAADGSDANYGLRGLKGLSAPRNHSQAPIQLSESEHMASVHPPGRIYRSRGHGAYHTRAWTFQEYQFSFRRLVFHNDAVEWHCQHGQMHEDVVSETFDRRWDTYDVSRYSRTTVHQMFASSLPTLGSLARLVYDFNGRKLSFPEDAFPAFTGIQGSLEQFYQVSFLYGLPEFWFELALCWAPSGDLTRREASNLKSSTGMFYHLPSWSWIGWGGRIYFPSNEVLVSINEFTEPITKWYALVHPDSPDRRPVGSAWFEYRSRATEEHLVTLPEGWERLLDRERGYVFKHARELYERYSYAFPVPEPLTATDSISVPQTAYLSAQTSRAFLRGTRRHSKEYVMPTEQLLTPKHPMPVEDSVWLMSSQGQHVGYLRLNNAEERSLFKHTGSNYVSPNPLELVAICKGITTYLLAPGLDWDIELDRLYRAQVNTSQQDRQAVDCIHVLWIEWIDGIAYRRACGAVTAEAWEQEKEKDLVDLILG